MNQPEQISIFPTANSLEEVQQIGLASLPITEPNQLIVLLQMQANTIHSILEKEKRNAPTR